MKTTKDVDLKKLANEAYEAEHCTDMFLKNGLLRATFVLGFIKGYISK